MKISETAKNLDIYINVLKVMDAFNVSTVNDISPNEKLDNLQLYVADSKWCTLGFEAEA